MKIITGKLEKTQRVVAYGPEGIGKSSFGSRFPNPIFIDTEGSTDQLDVARTPKPSSWAMLKQQVQEVSKLGFQTLVIDTIDWAERLCVEHVCAAHNKSGIESFGYGQGYTFVEEEFGKFLNLLNDVRESGMHIVLLAHAQIKKFELPEEQGAYDRWELKLTKKNCPLVKEWSDMVLFCNYKIFVVEDERTKKKKAQGGKRIILTTHNPCWDAKNRHGLAEELPLDYTEIAQLFTASPESAKEPTPQNVEPEPENYERDEREAIDNEKQVPDGIPSKLFELMEARGVTEEEIQKVVALRGYYPEQTPIFNYSDDFVNGVLIAAWDKVFGMIEQTRKQNAA